MRSKQATGVVIVCLSESTFPDFTCHCNTPRLCVAVGTGFRSAVNQGLAVGLSHRSGPRKMHTGPRRFRYLPIEAIRAELCMGNLL